MALSSLPTYAVVAYFGLRPKTIVGGWTIDASKVPIEVWVVVSTYVAYQVGDVLDKVTFKKSGPTGEWEQRYLPEDFEDAREKARDALGIHHGSYRVSLSILEAAHEGRFSVHLINEGAKFLRSLIIPAWLISLILAAATLPIGLALLVAAASTAFTLRLAYRDYPKMKVRHMTNLYRAIPAIMEMDKAKQPDKRKLFIHDEGELRWFLWDGDHIATARKAAPRDTPSPEPTGESAAA